MTPGSDATGSVSIEGIGFWARGLPDWEAAQRFAAHGGALLPQETPPKPSARLLAPNERRRAPETVAVALEVALAACQAAQRDPATLPSVFASTHGDLAVTDYICETLATDPKSVSPIKFHNSVHNAAAGYWTIGVGATHGATALSAYDASFAQGLIEAVALLFAGAEAVLLVAYDGQASGPLAQVSPSDELLGGALVLSRATERNSQSPAFRLRFETGKRAGLPGVLERRFANNAMAQMLPLFDALTAGAGAVTLVAGPAQVLHVELTKNGYPSSDLGPSVSNRS